MVVLIKQILQLDQLNAYDLEVTIERQAKNREQIGIIRKEEVLYKKHSETSWVTFKNKIKVKIAHVTKAKRKQTMPLMFIHIMV